jgi:hypothetical protein
LAHNQIPSESFGHLSFGVLFNSQVLSVSNVGVILNAKKLDVPENWGSTPLAIESFLPVSLLMMNKNPSPRCGLMV